MAKVKAAKRKFIDWDSIEPLYRAGAMSNYEICRQYEADHVNSQVWKQTVTHSAIIKKAKEKKWSKNLASKVSERIKERLVTGLVTGSNQTGGGGSDKEIIERASDTGVNIVLRHRNEIFELQAHEKRLLKSLQDGPKKLYLANYQGEIIEKEYDVTLKEQSATLKDLAAVRAQRIILERQAHNLDDPDQDAARRKEMALSEVLGYLPLDVREAIKKRAAGKVGK